MVREDFGVLILTHGRADRILTVKALERCGYTGKWYIVIDDEDKQESRYREKFGNRVIQFNKGEIDKTADRGDNIVSDKRGILWARLASFGIAERLGLRYFMMLDDDYMSITTKLTDDDELFCHEHPIKHFDNFINLAIKFLESTGACSVAFGQGGDYIAGLDKAKKGILTKKAMNSFICRADTPVAFAGRFNEDVNAYVGGWLTGREFYTIMPVVIHQAPTQTIGGGITEAYKEAGGTFIKTMHSVCRYPACVDIRAMGMANRRIHHNVRWANTAPKIIREIYAK